MAYETVKRVFDFVLSAAGLILLWPLLVVVSLVVWIRLGRPVFFRQERPGLHGETFELIKFRTMRTGQEPDEVRLTSLGAKLRRTSLDELPELVNVLRGEMSLVGPRPLLVRYLDLYDERQSRRHDVRPGITGLAQVEGRNALDWETRLELDVQYTEKMSPSLDLAILLRTARAAVSGEGVTAPGKATGLFLDEYLEHRRKEEEPEQ